jgi:hypothetical protein
VGEAETVAVCVELLVIKGDLEAVAEMEDVLV